MFPVWRNTKIVIIGSSLHLYLFLCFAPSVTFRVRLSLTEPYTTYLATYPPAHPCWYIFARPPLCKEYKSLIQTRPIETALTHFSPPELASLCLFDVKRFLFDEQSLPGALRFDLDQNTRKNW